ncbi:MAG: hypothetical protein ABIG68_02510 [Acidobacteriota bacterium]
MKNLALEPIEYKIEETPRGVWRRFVYANGESFAEYHSHTQIFGMPFLHFTRGKCPETGARVVARGFVAVGRLAVGIIAVGQASADIVAFGQASLGLLVSLAQAGAGLFAVGQLALGGMFGAGQLATGATAIGQLALGQYVLAQFGVGEHLWTTERADPAAVEYFHGLWNWLQSLFGA